MKRLVRPHNLRNMCTEAGTTLEDLSALTHISVEALILFSRGQLALNARERLAIAYILDVASDEATPAERRAKTADSMKRTLSAIETLFSEANEEEAAERSTG